jgi:DNA processing protein
VAWSPRESWAVRLNAGLTPPLRAKALLDALGPARLASASAGDWAAVLPGARLEEVRVWRESSLAFDPAAEEKRVDALGARLMLRGDEGYPDLLESIHDPPLVLYMRGRFGARPPVAFVGSRFPSACGSRNARRLAGASARAGLTIVSGLARGIDADCHEAALAAGGDTWAVLGSGLGRVYPAENRALAERIVAAGGVVLSEMPVEQAPVEWVFPRRNRIVAGLSWGVVVIEGRHRSGSLITARLAGEMGRELWAVPGPADSPLSEAPHRLLADGAVLTTEAGHILATLPPGLEIEPLDGEPPPPVRTAPPTADEARILALLGGDALSLDDLVRLSGLDTGRISSIMFGLEIKEAIISRPGQLYAQKARGR